MNYIDSLKFELSAETKKEQENQNQIKAAEAQHIYEREFSTVFINQYVKPKIKECMRNNQTSYSGVFTSYSIDNYFLCNHLQSELLELGLRRCKVKYFTYDSYAKYSKYVTKHYVLYLDIAW